ncbi:uncharacterized protein N0V89_009746 [Didymosphaeria variabile]|uniref:Uncharacterized protein n=1 Tax=Didymosphaeria variabile TaxID=1932322 RepID=A0A9W9C6V3_9PLEO|nr:uncharacterized protein N0V89_009746 [Didymosphaeria variabile]KAJ4348372.1 hypothetical protein N0V89_009746 [Didymosphaeria variabile]
MKAEALQKAVGVQGEESYDAFYLRHIRPRITTDAYPERFSLPKVDIRDHLSPEEVRIAIARFVEALTVSLSPKHVSLFGVPKVESWRRLGIHPMVTGVDLDFLWVKMRKIRESVTGWTEFLDAVDTMLSPVFDRDSLDLEEAQSRATKLIESHTLEVMKWSAKDQVAAMGVRHSTVTVYQNDREVPVYDVVGKLIAQALKARLTDDTITAEEEAAITVFLTSKCQVQVAKKPQAFSKGTESEEDIIRHYASGDNEHQ